MNKYCGTWLLENRHLVIRDVDGKELAFITNDEGFGFAKHVVYIAIVDKKVYPNIKAGLQMYVDPMYHIGIDHFTIEQAKTCLEEILIQDGYTIITDKRLLNIS